MVFKSPFGGFRGLQIKIYVSIRLKFQGLDRECLDNVFTSLIVSKILYCLPAWGGFLKEFDINRINKQLKRGKGNNFTNHLYDFKGLLEHCDRILFEKMKRESHCLYYLLSPVASNSTLRLRGHSYHIPLVHTDKYKRSYIPRYLLRCLVRPLYSMHFNSMFLFNYVYLQFDQQRLTVDSKVIL